MENSIGLFGMFSVGLTFCLETINVYTYWKRTFSMESLLVMYSKMFILIILPMISSAVLTYKSQKCKNIKFFSCRCFIKHGKIFEYMYAKCVGNFFDTCENIILLKF